MSQVVQGKFACDACGKKYTWKPALAGKRAKCACGSVITVPREEATQPDDLYDLAEAPAEPVAAVAPVIPAIRRSIPTRARDDDEDEGAIDYETNPKRDRFSFESLTYSPRDFYLPVILLITGFIGFAGWAVAAADVGKTGMVIVMLGMTVVTLIKTVVVIALAMAVAWKLGISFGTFWTAVLKFAAILIFTDMLRVWFDEILESAGAMSRNRIYLRILFIEMILVAAVIGFLCRFLFDMEPEEVGMFAVPLALVSMFVGFLLKLGLVAVLSGMSAGATAPAGAGTGAGAGGGGPAPGTSPPVPGVAETTKDREISERIRNRVGVKEARESLQSRVMRNKAHERLVDALYAAGVVKVYHDMLGGMKGNEARLYVQLPEDPDGRKACVEAAKAAVDAYEKDIRKEGLEELDEQQKYLVIQLKA